MKKILFILVVLASTIFCYAETLNEQVNRLYEAKQYDQIIESLEAESKVQKEQGLESADLYYNLGNAYFRNNEIAKAILNYERAALLNPGDKDIKNNIIFAQTKIEDKFALKEGFVLSNIYGYIQNLVSSNTWSVISVIFFLLLLACVGIFFYFDSELYKKISFYTGIVLIIFLISTNVFAYKQKKRIEDRNTAIVMRNSVSAYSEPNPTEKQLFILNSGSKVKILKEDGDWCQVEIINGDKGWIEKNKFEII